MLPASILENNQIFGQNKIRKNQVFYSIKLEGRAYRVTRVRFHHASCYFTNRYRLYINAFIIQWYTVYIKAKNKEKLVKSQMLKTHFYSVIKVLKDTEALYFRFRYQNHRKTCRLRKMFKLLASWISASSLFQMVGLQSLAYRPIRIELLYHSGFGVICGWNQWREQIPNSVST